MSDFFEIDFLKVETSKSGDAIAIRYCKAGVERIHVVDGGYLETGEELVEHIRAYYNKPTYIDHVVLTHGDRDHASGLIKVLEEFDVGVLWILRPWLYADELLPRFKHINSIDYLTRRLKESYPYIAKLEAEALRRGIVMKEPFQGAQIGEFRVLTPSRQRFLELVVSSEKTPQEIATNSMVEEILRAFSQGAKHVLNKIRAAWGVEVFSSEGTSNENEMSVVQYANICNQKILLTGDTGRDGLSELIGYAPLVGLSLPGIDRFQVPHHGSRRNVSSDLLDRILGPKLAYQVAEPLFTAIISSAAADEDHPRSSVVRAMIHRGATVITTEGKTVSTGYNAPFRSGWSAIPGTPYPQEQETD